MKKKYIMTPNKIVKELDKYIIGQYNAKKIVAIALRNRWRRNQINSDIKKIIIPHNILMIGSTGIGKTEIARKLADIIRAPFLKIEATKFTEIGYVGRDVDSIIKDLLEISIKTIKKNLYHQLKKKAIYKSKIELINQLVGKDTSNKIKNIYLKKIDQGKLDNKNIKISIDNNINNNNNKNTFPTFDMSGLNNQIGIININDIMYKNINKQRKKIIKIKIKRAIKFLIKREIEKLVNEYFSIEKAIDVTEKYGIVFLDEIDKIATNGNNKRNDINKDGVQRDLLPIIEGTVINTKYGSIKTNYILFITSGAFHVSKPSDLLPELQGRLPIKIKLKELTKENFFFMLTKNKNSLIMQYKELLKIERIDLHFTIKSIILISKYAEYMNHEIENIGARRLHMIIEKILYEINFIAAEIEYNIIIINYKFVQQTLKKNINIENLENYII